MVVFDELVSAVMAEGLYQFQLVLVALALGALTFVSNSTLVVSAVLVADLKFDALPFYGFYHFLVFTILWKSPYKYTFHGFYICFMCCVLRVRDPPSMYLLVRLLVDHEFVEYRVLLSSFVFLFLSDFPLYCGM